MHDNQLRVLVADDNKMNQVFIRQILHNEGIASEAVASGNDAIRKLQEEKFDLVLMDIHMPGMDGYAATQAIRTTLGLTIPIIGMTANTFPGETERCLHTGMNNSVFKPVREQELILLIRSFFPADKKEAADINIFTDASVIETFRYIQLHYLREVSCGNKVYERAVSEAFIESVPRFLQDIAAAWQSQDVEQLQGLAHNMRNDISVFSLNALLGPHLDVLESAGLTEKLFYQHFRNVEDICAHALQEVRRFCAGLQNGSH